MLKKIFCVAAVAFSLLMGQVAFAACGEGMKTMIESLKLDDSQKAKIKPVMEKLQASMKEAVPQMLELRKQMHEQVMSDKMDQSVVDGLVDKKVKLMGDMMKAKMSAKNQIMGILNDKQKAQMHTMMKDAEEKMMAKYKSCHDED